MFKLPLLKKHKISVNDFARMYSKSTSEAARMLQNLSRISLSLKRALKTANSADVENFKCIQKIRFICLKMVDIL